MIKPFNLDLLCELPINPNLTNLVNKGEIENYQGRYLENLVNLIMKDFDIDEE